MCGPAARRRMDRRLSWSRQLSVRNCKQLRVAETTHPQVGCFDATLSDKYCDPIIQQVQQSNPSGTVAQGVVYVRPTYCATLRSKRLA